MAGGLDVADVWITFGWAGALTAVFVPLTLRAYRRKVR